MGLTISQAWPPLVVRIEPSRSAFHPSGR